MSEVTPATPQTSPQVLQVREVTPSDPRHIGFGRVWTIIKQEGEFIFAEIKDGIHFLEAKFHNSQIKPIVTPNIPIAAQPTTPVVEPSTGVNDEPQAGLPLSAQQAAAVEAQSGGA